MASSSLKVSGNAMNRIRALLAKSGRSASLSVGVLEGSTSYPDGQSVAMVAATNEFGNPTNNQPPRPFFRQTINQKSDSWANTFGKAMEFTKGDVRQALELLGQRIVGDIQQTIDDFRDPPNADSTIKKKGFDKPLIDTGHMRNMIQYRVDE